MRDRLRPEHVDEVMASHRFTPERALLVSYLNSQDCFTFEHQGRPIAMFGVAQDPLTPGAGSIWLLGSTEVTAVPRMFLKLSRRCLAHFRSKYWLLQNWADARFNDSILWLRWLGAEVHPAIRYGAQGLPFHYFKFQRGF